MNAADSVTVFAPASVGNAGVGYDLLGFAVDAVGDRVTLTAAEPGLRITGIAMRRADGSLTDCTGLPCAVEYNTATVGILRLLAEHGGNTGFDVEIEKGIPLCSGLGGSAASAVAGVVAANELLGRPLERTELVAYALAGEALASGAAHEDNVVPSLLGGLRLCRWHSERESVRLPVPDGLLCVLVHPDHRVATREARAALPDSIPLQTCVAQSGQLAGFLVGCYENDARRAGQACRDRVVEPYRAPLVPGFRTAHDAALAAGAWSFGLSGAGPAVFALCEEAAADAVLTAVTAAFREAGPEARGWISAVGTAGARVEAAG